mmetsp:Transcript_30761/g.70954  ORF Transcript_30761/g.70954 Transcript_30761/m.70954 type:complete len:581 (-) Transcript_30761:134-1876(-)
MDPSKLKALTDQTLMSLLGPDGPFSIGTTRIGTREFRCFTKGPKTLPAFFARWYQEQRDKTFVVFQNERLTFGEFESRAAALGKELMHTYGIRQGDRVALSMVNYPEWPITWAAVTAIGAIVVPLNSFWKEEELKYGLQDSGSRVLICDEERLRRALPCIDSLDVKIIVCRPSRQSSSSRVADFTSVIQAGERRGGGVHYVTNIDPDSTCCIMYTSGTTGHPKGVMQSHRGVCDQMAMAELASAAKREVFKALGVTPPTKQGCVICPVPLFHVTGCLHIFLSCLVDGRKLVLMTKWNAGEALMLIEREQATGWTGVPTMLQDMMEHPDFKTRNVSSLEVVGSGGAPNPPPQVKKVGSQFPAARPSQGYGLTETCGAVCSIVGDDYLLHPGSTGKPFPICEAKIVDVDTGADLPHDGVARGELLVRSSLVMLGYWNKKEATDKAVDPQGWFRTGDVSVIDPEGFVYIVDRAKDIVIRGGENISCSEVEGAVMLHPSVMEVAAFGVPHPRLGEEMAIMVMPKPGATVTAQEIVSHVTPHLASFKVPPVANVFFTTQPLPRGATGKTLKRQIRESVVNPRSKL